MATKKKPAKKKAKTKARKRHVRRRFYTYEVRLISLASIAKAQREINELLQDVDAHWRVREVTPKFLMFDRTKDF